MKRTGHEERHWTGKPSLACPEQPSRCTTQISPHWTERKCRVKSKSCIAYGQRIASISRHQPSASSPSSTPLKLSNAAPKGVSGNPGGRPRGRVSITAALRELAAQVAPNERGNDSPEGQTWAERVALRLLEGASHGDASLARLVLDRIDGRAPDSEPSACEPMEFAPIVLRSSARDALR